MAIGFDAGHLPSRQRLWHSRDYMEYLYGRPDMGYWGLIGIRDRTAVRRLLGLKVSD